MYKKLRYSKQLFLFLTLTTALFLQGQAVSENPSAEPTSYDLGSVHPSITIKDYGDFLNEVASNDPHHLYDAKISDGSAVSLFISRSGEPGGYHYAVHVQKEEEPMTFMSWLDAARYCNWKENTQSAASSRRDHSEVTEYGAYELEDDTLVAINAEASTLLAEDGSSSDRQLQSSRVGYFFKNILNAQSGSQNGDNSYFSAENVFLGLLLGLSIGAAGKCTYESIKNRDENVEDLKRRLSPSSQGKFHEALRHRDLLEDQHDYLVEDISLTESFDLESMYRRTGRTSLEVKRMKPQDLPFHYQNQPTSTSFHLIKEPLSLIGFKTIGDQSRANTIDQHQPLTIGRSWDFNYHIEPASFEKVNPPEGYKLPDEFMKALGAQSHHFTDEAEARKTGLTPDLVQKTFDRIATFDANVHSLKKWFEKKSARKGMANFADFSNHCAGILEQIKDIPDHFISDDHRNPEWTHESMLTGRDFQTFFKNYKNKSSSSTIATSLDPESTIELYFGEQVRSLADLWTSFEIQQKIEKQKTDQVTKEAKNTTKGNQPASQVDLDKENSVPSLLEVEEELATAYATLASYRTKALHNKTANYHLAIECQQKAIQGLTKVVTAVLENQKSSDEKGIVAKKQNLKEQQGKVIESLLQAARSQSSQSESLSNLWFPNSFKSLLSTEGAMTDGEHFKRVADAYEKAIKYQIKANNAVNHDVATICNSIAKNQKVLAWTIEETLRNPLFKKNYGNEISRIDSYLLKQISCFKEAEIRLEAKRQLEFETNPFLREKKDRKLEEAEAWGRATQEAVTALEYAKKASEEKNSANGDRVSLTGFINRLRGEDQLANWTDLQREQESVVNYCEQQAEALEKKDNANVLALNKVITAQKVLISYLQLSRNSSTVKKGVLNKKASIAYKDIIPEVKKLEDFLALRCSVGTNKSKPQSKALGEAITCQRLLIANLKNIVRKIQDGATEEVIDRLRLSSLKDQEAVTEAEKLMKITKQIDSLSGEESSPDYKNALTQVQNFQKALMDRIVQVARDYYDETITQQVLRERLILINRDRVAAAEKRAELVNQKSKVLEIERPEWDNVINYQSALIDKYTSLIMIPLAQLESAQKKNGIVISKYKTLVDALIQKIELNSNQSSIADKSSSLGDSYIMVDQKSPLQQALSGELTAAKGRVLNLQQQIIEAALASLGTGSEEDLKKPMPEEGLKIKLYEPLVKTAQRVVELKEREAARLAVDEDTQDIGINLYAFAAKVQNSLLDSQQKNYDAVIEKGTLSPSYVERCCRFLGSQDSDLKAPEPSAEECLHRSFVTAYENLMDELQKMESEQDEATTNEAQREVVILQRRLLKMKMDILAADHNTCFGGPYKASTRFCLVDAREGTAPKIEWLNRTDRNQIVSLEHLILRAQDLVKDQKTLATITEEQERSVLEAALQVKEAQFDISKKQQFQAGEDTSYWEKAARAQEGLLSLFKDQYNKEQALAAVQQGLDNYLTSLEKKLDEHRSTSAKTWQSYQDAGQFNLAERYQKEVEETESGFEKNGVLELLSQDQLVTKAQAALESSNALVKQQQELVTSCQEDAILADKLASDPDATSFQKWKLWISSFMKRPLRAT